MINDFLQVDLISELGLDKLPEDQKNSLLNQMMETLDNRLASEVFPLLADEDVTKLERLSDGGEDVKIFLKERIPTVELIATEVVAQFKKEMLELNSAVDRARSAN